MDKSKPEKVNCQNLRECIEDLKKVLSPSELETFKTTPRDKLIIFHFTLGLFIRNRYLYGTPLLESILDKLTFIHEDDISGLIIEMLWLSLNQVPCSQPALHKFLKRQYFLLRNDQPSEEELMSMFGWE